MARTGFKALALLALWLVVVIVALTCVNATPRPLRAEAGAAVVAVTVLTAWLLTQGLLRWWGIRVPYRPG